MARGYSIIDLKYSNGEILFHSTKKDDVLKWILDGMEGTQGCGCEQNAYCTAMLDLLKYNRRNIRFMDA